MLKEVAEGLAKAFNSQWPIGTVCILVHDLGEHHVVTTTTQAWVLDQGGDEAQPMVGISTGNPEKKFPRGPWILTRIVPINPNYE